ncbi:MFS transporter [Cryobacterium adonitolivorans]|uniref:MFS transporter n=1 Tax=Cryobacterium adonitolivorans TaxID=1259189 RepID=A0A4R8W230_9MICO|nr:MFS transporter [Cryobacterium adonitolivorans]TFC01030.1 MFS transporter [Cryobacterium adonitolivorans]
MTTPRVTLIVAILASFAAFLDGSIVTVALPAIAKDLGGGVGTQQWVLDAYLLSLGSLILLAGSLADSFGSLRILRIGLCVFGLASIACALAPTASVLIATRGVQGIGAALLVPSSLALITSTFSGEAKGRAIGAWTAWTSTAFIVGPLLGGILVDTLGWRHIFAINVIPILVTLFLTRGGTTSSDRRTQASIDSLGAALAALGLAGSVFALIEQQNLGWTSPLVLAPLTIGLACLVAFILWERHTAYPMLPLTLFRSQNFRNGNLATAAIYAGVSLGLLVVVLFLQEAAGFTATMAGMATLPIALISLALSRTFGTLAGKHGPRLFMTLGPALAAAGFLLMLTARSPINFWWQILPGLLLYGTGLAITVAPLTTAVLSSISATQAGVGSAVNNAVARISGLVAIAFMSTVIGSALTTGSFHRALTVTAGLFLTGSVISAVGIRNGSASDSPIPAEAAANCTDRAILTLPPTFAPRIMR